MIGPESAWMAARPDVALGAAQQRAAERVLADSRKDWWPTGTVAFDPQRHAERTLPTGPYLAVHGALLAANLRRRTATRAQGATLAIHLLALGAWRRTLELPTPSEQRSKPLLPGAHILRPLGNIPN